MIQRLGLHSELGKDTGLAIAISKNNVLIGFQVTGGWRDDFQPSLRPESPSLQKADLTHDPGKVSRDSKCFELS